MDLEIAALTESGCKVLVHRGKLGIHTAAAVVSGMEVELGSTASAFPVLLAQLVSVDVTWASSETYCCHVLALVLACWIGMNYNSMELRH